MRSSIGQRLGAGFALPLLILVILGAVSHRALNNSVETSRWVDHTYEVLDTLAQLQISLLEAESAQRGYLITGKEEFLQPFQRSAALVPVILKRVTELTADNPRQQQRLEEVKPMIEALLLRLKKRSDLRRAKGLEAMESALPTEETQETVDRFLKKRTELEEEERRLLKERAAESESSIRTTQAITLWGTALGFAVVSLAGLFIIRGISGPIQAGVQRIASAASEILAATTQQATGTQEESAAVQETTTTVHEVRQTAQLSSEKAQAVADLVRKTSQTSQEGRRAAEETLQGMQEAKARMEGIAERVLGLSEHGQAIGEIIATVNGLAEQSNLLAVNAAIEAAKAGEAGKGFSVVASEVKALAEQSKQATGQVRQILGEIQRATQTAVLATEQGVKASEAGEGLARRAGEAILQLTESLSDAAQAAQQIFVTAQEQSAGVDQVATAMENIRQVSTQNMAATRQMERAARDLSSIAQQFKALVTGSGHGERAMASTVLEAGSPE
ncbi:MAG TPA: methyl-accepting chemotaxis protein [Vicinamibacteria bacterium]|nr:methyl-accepting chemotaxis protein [Vicinamibacteria bacterium]